MNASQDSLNNVPKNLYGWLVLVGPLTEALKQIFPDWQLQVLSQEWHENSKTWVREIAHVSNKKNLVYAKLEVPEQSFKSFKSELQNLGSKPIGVTLLYGNPDVTRSAFSYSKLACPMLGDGLYWARQSTFYWNHLPLTLTEIFSPDLPELK
ncbi:MAG: hypothetical protein K0R66_1530 [Gammaproteobacteria bacterium]|nr:hypothetical protein [Gammaproteobacteria bacterium]